jgi:hypothetical protein
LQRNRDAVSGRMLSQLYADEGFEHARQAGELQRRKLENAVEPVIMEMLNYMQSVRFYVLAHLTDWFSEFRDYYRREGVIVKRLILISAAVCIHDAQICRVNVVSSATCKRPPRRGGRYDAVAGWRCELRRDDDELTERETTPGKY